MEDEEKRSWGGAREYVDKLKAIAAREGLTDGKLLQIMIDERA